MSDCVIIYYTDNQLLLPIARSCQRQLKEAAGGIPIICVSQEPERFGDLSITMGPLGRSRQSMFQQIQTGLRHALHRYNPHYVFTAEHDILYPKEWFDFRPPDPGAFYYCLHKYYMYPNHFDNVSFRCLSTLCCDFRLLLSHINLRVYRTIQMKKKKGGWTNSEPGVSQGDPSGLPLLRTSRNPCVDIRHDNNVSKVTRTGNRLQDIPYWGNHAKLKEKIGWP